MVTRMEQRSFFEMLFENDVALPSKQAEAAADRDGRAVMIAELLWPALRQVDQLRRDDALPEFFGRMAIRRIGTLARRGSSCSDRYHRGRLTALVVSGTACEDETCADIAASLLESLGIVTRVCGGGVPQSQLLDELRDRPVDLLFIASIGPAEAPSIRRFMDQVREMPQAIRPQILAGGGLFARAEGLALEMGADLEVNHPGRLLSVLSECRPSSFERDMDRPGLYAA